MQVVKCKVCKQLNRLTPSVRRHAAKIGKFTCQRCGCPLKVSRVEPVDPIGETVACPMCRRKQAKRAEHAVYWCAFCAASFDGNTSENSDAYNDPVKSAEVHEQMASRRRGGRVGTPNRKGKVA